ncbi:MAG: DUF4197 domain-containing protein [Pseudomonadota bacterium]
MRPCRHIITQALAITLLLSPTSTTAGWQDVLSEVTRAIQTSSAPSETDIAAGLREALAVGTRNAVAAVGRPDGYFTNADIKILLPDNVQQLESLLRSTGLGDQLDRFVLSMNRAAETAAPQATAIFLDAASRVTFADAATILNGRVDEATRYFKDNTQAPLTDLFTPIVHESMASVGVTRAYHDLDNAAQRIPFISDRLRFDLDAYVTARALDGIFLMVAQEERRLRENPQARSTELLKKVFGAARTR